MLNQKDAWGFARVAEPGACVAETGNAKKPRIGFGGETYQRKVTAFELNCNICGKQLE